MEAPSSTQPSAAPEPQGGELIAVGRIRDAWGVAGGFKVEPYNDPRESLLRSVRRWWLTREPSSSVRAGAATDPASLSRELRVLRCRIHGDGLVARAEGVDDRTAAESLKGFEVWVRRADFPKAGANEFYWIDLIGCEVIGQGDVSLGTVQALDDHGAHPILIISAGDHERLVPFVDAYLIEVDPGRRLIRVDWNADW